MKKILSVVFCLLFVFCLSACSRNNQLDDNTIKSSSDTIINEEINAPTLHSEYALIINSIINAYPWNDDELTIVPQNPELSYMYRRNTELSEIGFALLDLDRNGQEELIISDPSKFVYDVYTISNNKSVHLFASGERNYYILYENGYIENQWSGSAATSGHDFYQINDGKLVFVERITFDAYHALDVGVIKELTESTDNNSFFVSPTDQFEDYKLVSSEEAIQKIDAHQKANKQIFIEYILLSEYKKQ